MGGVATHDTHCVWYRFSEGDDPKVFEAKIQVHVIFTWVLSLVAGDVTPLLEAKIQKKRDFAWVQTPPASGFFTASKTPTASL